MKTVNVVCAVIEKENRILLAARARGEFAGLYEFPGGKIEPGETGEEALTRELKEELEIDVRVLDHFYTLEYDYPSFHLSMQCFRTVLLSDNMILHDHLALKWVDPLIVPDDLVPADVIVFEKYSKLKKKDEK